MESRIPLTVVGGYLGAGKTTLVNRLLRSAAGRRIGVIVNDFGALAVDADLLADAAVDGDVISLANGCVCCTVGAGLHEALATLATQAAPPDHVVIEVSGVADPAVAAGWGTVPPFEPAGVVVLADLTDVRRLARDRYVGDEVRRQLAGADLVVATKADLAERDAAVDVESWLAGVSGGAPVVRAVGGDLDPDVVLGVARAGRVREDGHSHVGKYVTWSWSAASPVDPGELRLFVDGLPPGVLRAKGVVELTSGSSVVVQVTGRRREIVARPAEVTGPGRLVVIALTGTPRPDAPSPFASESG